MNALLGMCEQGPARRRDWTAPLRREAIAHVVFPTSKDEAWKYTPVGPLLEPQYQLPRAQEGLPRVPAPWLERDGAHLVFWNGRFVRALSTAPTGELGPLSQALVSSRPLLEPHLGVFDSAFVALNTALMEDGAFIEVAAGRKQTVHLLFVASADAGPLALHLRNVFLVGAGAELTVLETHVGEGVYLDNTFTQALLGEGATLRHCREQHESPTAFHVGRLAVDCDAGSQLSSHTLAMGSRLARSEVIARLLAPGAGCTLNGLYAARDHQHLDLDTRIEHLGPRCRSRELFHGILAANARGIFTGRVLVAAGAQQTDAGQTNRNLLLSDDAEAKTRPHLQIFADDVKCAHGATVGALDDEALFYLRSRGIPAERARAMLTWAFATTVTSTMPLPQWRLRAERALTEWVGEEAPR